MLYLVQPCPFLGARSHSPSEPCGGLLLYGNTAHPSALGVFLLNRATHLYMRPAFGRYFTSVSQSPGFGDVTSSAPVRFSAPVSTAEPDATTPDALRHRQLTSVRWGKLQVGSTTWHFLGSLPCVDSLKNPHYHLLRF